MLKRISVLVLILAIAVLFAACANKPVEKQAFLMGTNVTETVYGKNAEQAANAGMSRIKQLESMMTINKDGGEINALNGMSNVEEKGGDIKLSPETMFVLKTAKKYSELSGGAFDVTVGPLVKAWGIFTQNPKVLSEDEIKKLLPLVDYKSLSLNESDSTARLLKPGMVVDLGGIAKGFAGDEVVKIYKSLGIKSALVNLGGNVVTLGNKPDGTPWVVGIQNPRAEDGKYIATLKVSNKAVVTSGDYERYFEKDGVRYCHIMDPATGRPADSGLISTTIITDQSINADALSTATFVLGLDKGMKLVESQKGVEAIFVTKDKKVYITPGLKDIFTFDDASKEFQYVEKR